jgi:hypothetical protein
VCTEILLFQYCVFNRYTSSVIKNLITATNDHKVYDRIVAAFLGDNDKKLLTCVQEGVEGLRADNNLGLAKQVLDSVMLNRIRKLNITYSNMRLEDMAKLFGLADNIKETEAMIVKMVRHGDINACIDQKSGIVELYDGDEDPRSNNADIDSEAFNLALIQSLEMNMDKTLALTAQIRETETALLLSKPNIMKALGVKPTPSGRADYEEGMDVQEDTS